MYPVLAGPVSDSPHPCSLTLRAAGGPESEPPAKNLVIAADGACFEQHVESSSGHGLLLYKSFQEREVSSSEDFLAGEIRAVLREICTGRRER